MKRFLKIFEENNINKTISISFITLFILFGLNILFSLVPIYQKSISNINYDSKSTNLSLSTPKKFKLKNFDGYWFKKSLKISFKFKLYNYELYDNLFQTANLNNGVRIEFNEYKNAGILVKNKNEKLQFSVLMFPNTISPYEYYSLNINKSPDKNMQIKLNDENLDFFYALDEYEVNDVVIGQSQGFGEKRLFNGEIKDFNLIYKVYITPIFFNILEIIAFIFLLCNLIAKLRLQKSNDFCFPNMFFVFLLNLYPAAFLYNKNIFELEFLEFLSLTGVILVLSLIFYLLTYKIMVKSKFLPCATVLLISFYSYGYVNDFLNLTLLTWSLIMLVTVCFILFIKQQLITADKVIKFMLIVLYVMLIAQSFTNIKSCIKSVEPITNKTTTNINILKPNIYMIILDAHPSHKWLKETYGYDNSKFLKELENKGFYIAKNSYANYACTKHSIPSFLNFEYLDKLGIKNNDKQLIPKINKLHEYNKSFKIAKEQGYKIVAIQSNKIFTKKFFYSDEDIIIGQNADSKTLFNLLLEKSILSKFIEWNNADEKHRITLLNSFLIFNKELAKSDKKYPKFVYFHLLSPHYPLVFDKNGNFPEKSARNISEIDENYIYYNIKSAKEQIEYIEKKALYFINTILKDKNSVIILLSDHSINSKSKLPFKNDALPELEYAERLGNLEAVYFPDKDYSQMYQSITPVNLVRVLFNKYFYQNLEKLPDEHFFALPPTSYVPKNVTNIVKKYYE